MTFHSRKEILAYIQNRSKAAKYSEKTKILGEFIATTGYQRKYAISLLNQRKQEVILKQNAKQRTQRKYDEAVRKALLTLWYAANQICSKRLVPLFLIY